ncbi:MAG: chemotaxis protein CheX [Candidatus Omnitrophota bacterium]|nr:chemotaxis protein CheX [Candidatus Omnitrophota bacterium]MDZ4242281.1 chemotaxis protein CheX [Candidatus Omnitrophota bacterium]
MIFGRKQNPDLEKFAEIFQTSIVGLFGERAPELKFSKPPVKAKMPIIEYNGKLRADGMEKFDNEPTYVSAINYYANTKDMEKKKALGTVVLYVQQNYISKLVRILQYPPVDDESDEAMQDSCGTLCNIIAGRFKSEISNAGYIELEMSHFVTYRNSAVSGVDFCYNEYDKYEIVFEIEGQKRLVVELSIGVVPRK